MMNKLELSQPLQPYADKAAIGLSLLCALHCLALPLLATLAPSLLALGLNDEHFHAWLVLVVAPLSAIALTGGCRKHQKYGAATGGLVGLTILCGTAFLGHDTLGETLERTLTLCGAGLIALSHLRNFQLCSKAHTCQCSA